MIPLAQVITGAVFGTILGGGILLLEGYLAERFNMSSRARLISLFFLMLLAIFSLVYLVVSLGGPK